MSFQWYDNNGNQPICIHVVGNIMYELFSDEEETLTEIYIPKEVTYHHTWRMYDCLYNLEALYAHAESEIYETFDGALYNKHTHTLLYVPLGKETLHIPKSAKKIGYKALNCCRLDKVTVDSENQNFKIVDGMLFDSEMECLHFIPCSQKVLRILPSVKWMDAAVLSREYDEIIVEQGNQLFFVVDGTLFEQENIKYISEKATRLIIPANTRNFFLPEKDLNLAEILVAKENPFYQAIDNVVYSKDCTTLIYALSTVKEITLPDELAVLDGQQIANCRDLSMISINLHTEFTAKSFAGLNSECEIIIRLDKEKSVTLSNLNHQALAVCINYLKGKDAEVKLGTEQFFLDIFLLGWDDSPSFVRAIRTSSWQIIKCLIDKNDITRVNALIIDGRLVTKNNISRIMRYTLEKERSILHDFFANREKW